MPHRDRRSVSVHGGGQRCGGVKPPPVPQQQHALTCATQPAPTASANAPHDAPHCHHSPPVAQALRGRFSQARRLVPFRSPQAGAALRRCGVAAVVLRCGSRFLRSVARDVGRFSRAAGSARAVDAVGPAAARAAVRTGPARPE
eukprot:scaffold14219_cov59-Phaeocystis_antarctica.AAC.6